MVGWHGKGEMNSNLAGSSLSAECSIGDFLICDGVSLSDI